MANNIGYEILVVGPTQAAPTLATVPGGVACAIFYVDPNAVDTVRWRSDGTGPTSDVGVPIGPGGHVVVAGTSNVVRSRFVSVSGKSVQVHALYYDRVDVIAFSGAPGGGATGNKAAMSVLEDTLAQILVQLRGQSIILSAMAIDQGVNLPSEVDDLVYEVVA